MKYFFITSIGCIRRHLDCERIKNYFIANKVELTVSPEKADYLFLSTCGLTKLHEDLSIDDILRFKRFKGEVIVGGCLPAMNAKRINSVFDGRIVNVKDLDRIDELFPDFSVKFKDVPDGNKICLNGHHKEINWFIDRFNKIDHFYFLKFINIFEEFYKKFLAKNLFSAPGPFPEAIARMPLIDFNNNFFSLRISSGCLGRCSYCNIKKAIGHLRSKPLSLLLEETRKAIGSRQYRINIISSDSGSYGLDIGSSLPQLLETIFKEDKRINITYLGNVHPIWMCRYKNELLKLIAGKRIKSIMVAIQSGSPRILKLMRRDGNLSELETLIKTMKKVYPHLRLRTQIIIGFPSENNQDLLSTIDFIKKCGFDEVDAFHYYENEAMDSAKIQPKIPADIIRYRMREVRKLLPVRITVNYFN